jgi:amino acid transporter
MASAADRPALRPGAARGVREKSVGAGPGRLGTFGGVFAPSILTILGLILFLRLGFVVGDAGLLRALLILAIATIISVSTSVSLSAIATNRKVRGGGVYFLISRSLGIGYGGSLGLLLFLAVAVSAAFYCVGFGEAVGALVPDGPPHLAQTAAAAAAAVLLLLAYLGADIATRAQYLIMAILGAALVSFFLGGFATWDSGLFEQNLAPLPEGLGFWPVFAIFFPAVTGFTQGVNMSGDLEDPARSLPLGTFLAVGISTVVYVGAMVLMAGALPGAQLAADYGAMKSIAAHPGLIHAGVLAATASSALASFLGAPRILQALARDRVFTSLSPFAAGAEPSGNPRRAVLLTGLIAFVVIAAGGLNAIARVVSMFFLISYGLLNYATYVEATANRPLFRPRFRFFDARASLVGTLVCLGVMFVIDAVAGVLAVAVLAAIYQYVRRTAVPAQWRDSRRAYRFRRVKDGLRELDTEPEGPADWQPHILVFTRAEKRRDRILRFASWISGGSGMITAVQLVEGEGTSQSVRGLREGAEAELRAEIRDQNLEVYPLVVGASDLRIGAATLVQSWGLGPIRSNTVVLNWMEEGSEGTSAELWYGRLLANAICLEQNVVVLNTDEASWDRLEEIPNEERFIDVWWFDDESSRLMLLFAYLMTRAEGWDEARIRVLIPTSAESRQKIEANVRRRLEESRIEAEIETIVDPDQTTVAAHSHDSPVVLLPLRVSGMRLSTPLSEDLRVLLTHLPVTALIAAAQDVQLTDDEAEPPTPTEPGPAEPQSPDDSAAA